MCRRILMRFSPLKVEKAFPLFYLVEVYVVNFLCVLIACHAPIQELSSDTQIFAIEKGG